MDPFIGQVLLFGGNFAPRGWAFCEGQLLAISGHDALFSILGTTYGGDGRTTFGLPDLRGRVAIQQGAGPGLPTYNLGQKVGNETTTLRTANLPNAPIHLGVSVEDGDNTEPLGNVPAIPANDINIYADTATGHLKPGSIQGAASAPFSNVPPVQSLHYIIALVGTYPSRS